MRKSNVVCATSGSNHENHEGTKKAVKTKDDPERKESQLHHSESFISIVNPNLPSLFSSGRSKFVSPPGSFSLLFLFRRFVCIFSSSFGDLSVTEEDDEEDEDGKDKEEE